MILLRPIAGSCATRVAERRSGDRLHEVDVSLPFFPMSHSVGTAGESNADGHSADDSTDVLETLEVRWFARGKLPTEVFGWFQAVVPDLEIEERVDSYLLTGRPDLGVKRRDQGPLEVKERIRVGRRVSVGGRLEASVEVWRKSIQLAPPEVEGRWIEVVKNVWNHPLRITVGGLTAACDIELAAVEVAAIGAWTLAFEASGPPEERLAALRSAAELFRDGAALPSGIASALEVEAGYPAWLIEVTGR
jgi:hypothetical protein